MLTTDFCVEAAQEAVSRYGLPNIFDTSRVCTAHDFLDTVVAVFDPTSRPHWSGIIASTPIVCGEYDPGYQ
jgi:hypothetical protein